MYFWILWFISSLIFFGFLGVIAAILSLLIYLFFKSKIVKIENIKDKGLSKQTQRENFMLDLSEILEKEQNTKFDINKIRSYKQILYYGKVREKIELIGMVIYNPSADFVNLVRIALNDENETVRILSSTSLQKMESYYEEKINELKQKFKESTNIKSTNFYFRKLIYTYSNFIDSTLIDASLKDVYIDKMFDEFSNIKNLKDNKLILYVYITISVKYNRLDGIEEILVDLIKRRNRTSDKFLLIELYYKKSDFTNLYNVLKSIDINKIRNNKQIDSYEYWSNI